MGLLDVKGGNAPHQNLKQAQTSGLSLEIAAATLRVKHFAGGSMKIACLFVLGVTLVSITAFAKTTSKLCRISEVTFNPWEEGLGVYGLTETDSDSGGVDFDFEDGSIESIKVGQMRFSSPSTSKGDDGATVYKGKRENETVEVTLYPSERGTVRYSRPGKPMRPMAKFDCSSVKEVESASIGDSNVKRLTKSESNALDGKVKKNLDAIDEAMELGDGYYDLVAESLYEVRSKKAKKPVVGYIRWSKLYYTEDKDHVTVTTKFDRNGLRLSKDKD